MLTLAALLLLKMFSRGKENGEEEILVNLPRLGRLDPQGMMQTYIEKVNQSEGNQLNTSNQCKARKFKKSTQGL